MRPLVRASQHNVRNIEKLWREFFSDPSQWWDNRSEKINSKYPDFKHKTSQEGLWLDGRLKPPWVDTKITAMAPDSIKPDLFTWNKQLERYLKDGNFKKTINVFQQMQGEGVIPDSYSFVRVVNACASSGALQEGRLIHAQITQSGYESNIYVGTCLVDMYAKCGSMEEAWKAFNKISNPNVVGWSAMILGYAKCGQGQKALEVYQQMTKEGVQPNSVTFVGLLNACTSLAALEEGRHVHEQITRSGLDSDLFVSNSLINMYAKCGSMEEAWAVFNKMSTRDVVTWSAMIRGLVKYGQGQQALELSKQMQLEGVDPDSVAFVGMLSACTSEGAIEEGRVIHEQIIQSGYESDVFVGNSLVDMYLKCGCLHDGLEVFENMPTRTVVTWSIAILGLVKCRQAQKALELSRQMQQEGIEPSPVTFVAILNACADNAALEDGRQIHKQIIESGCQGDVFVSSSLIDMYAKCGSIEDACQVFSNMPTRNAVASSAMIQGLINCGRLKKALELSRQMQEEGMEPNPETLVGALSACASAKSLEEGMRVHEQITERGWESNDIVSSGIIEMYTRFGCVDDAWRVFKMVPERGLVTWNAMIHGLVYCGEGKKAVKLSLQMEREMVMPDTETFVGIVNGCTLMSSLRQGRHVHEQIIESGCESDPIIGASLIEMYSKCGSTDDAWRVFNNMPVSNVAAWGAMIQGLMRCGQQQKALELLWKMQQDGVEPDAITTVGMLDTCASLTSLDNGRYIHENFVSSGCQYDALVGESLVHMYMKCGSIDDAWEVFNKMPVHDLVLWNAIIKGFVKRGQGDKAFHLFQQMQHEGLAPDPRVLEMVRDAMS